MFLPTYLVTISYCTREKWLNDVYIFKKFPKHMLIYFIAVDLIIRKDIISKLPLHY